MRRMGGSDDEEGRSPEGSWGEPNGGGGGNIGGAGGDNTGSPFDPGGNSETPRERRLPDGTLGGSPSVGSGENGSSGGGVPGISNPNVTSTPRTPRQPTPMSGSVSGVPNPSSGVIPFQPMAGGPIGSAGASKSSLFGSVGGLKGGGLGVPSIGGFNPQQGGEDNGQGGLIDSLMSILRQRKGMF